MDTACLCIRARRAANGLTALYDAALSPAGIKVTQFALLRSIARLGQPTITGVAEAAALDRSTLGRNLRVMAGMGLVALGPGRDERTRVVSLTDAGRATIAAAEPHWEAAQAKIEAALGGRRKREEAAALLSALEQLAA